MNIAHKLVNNLINENIFSVKGHLINTRLVIFGDNPFMLKHTVTFISQSKYFNIPV